MSTLPHGTWPSPLAPADLAIGQVRIDEVRPDGPDTWWLESRPSQEGRSALVRHTGASGTVADVLPAPWNVRSRVHEYGGGAYAVDAGRVVVNDLTSRRLHRLDPGSFDPVAITPQSADVRFGGLELRGEVLLAVREDHRGSREPVNTLVVLDLAGPNDDFGTALVQGPDFVLRPALSHDASQVAWVEYDHPNMPWDTTRLKRAVLRNRRLHGIRSVADTEGVSAVQPRWSAGGALWFATDESGWWNLHRLPAGEDAPAAVHLHDQDLASPQWTLGAVDYAILDEEHALVRRWVDGVARLGMLDARTGDIEDQPDDSVAFAHLGAASGQGVVLRGPIDRSAEVARGTVGEPWAVLATSGSAALAPEWVSPAEPTTWSNSLGQVVHGLLHCPRNPDAIAADDQRPPLLVMIHGGPTRRAEASFDLGTQFWTTRGFAVLQVNHGGSTGHGRDYRNRLRGQWGVVDNDDIVTGASALAAAGVVDPQHLAIRGGSAGGFAVLRALTTSTVFAAGTSYFGVADLAGLATETHKFESRYCDGLVAPWPDGHATYRDRSPLHHVADLSGRVLLLQGSDDAVVPLAQAQDMAAAMREAGHDVDLVVYDGEGHGFRRADSIIDSLTQELAFYIGVLGLEGPDLPCGP